MPAELQQPTRRATSADVARHAGFSRSTVSQILNGASDRFPDETREKVRQAAAALDYRPSRAGRALVTGMSDIIVIVVPNATFGPHLQDSVDRIAGATETTGMSVVVRFAGLDTASALTSVLDLRPSAVIDFGVFTTEQRARLADSGTLVLPDRKLITEGDDADPVDIYIGRLQVAELLRRSPRRLAYAGLLDGRLDPFGPPRLEGIRREAIDRGVPEPLRVRVPLDLDGAMAALQSLVDEAGDEPIGVCCYNDDVAIALLAGARALGLDVPRSLSVIGVDKTVVGQLISPRLSSVSIDQPTLLLSQVQQLSRLGGDQVKVGETPALSSVVHVVPGETT
ncbi:LacI family DNA-binding transcriptional regulator [Agreia sp. Leaf283]|uniref:LacI family DNA-binding transcriptional regulator n=1 Tax=Agreia sp. Leaf283 TaxID=1736321 RepID=UPI0006F94E6C|nr:LacI family DNA-binding transcriptional regulator [Agreia sp. Leaf283]KQP57577.1 hypothetical protein ASF51_07155 [Agreia sp. Leaf283]